MKRSKKPTFKTRRLKVFNSNVKTDHPTDQTLDPTVTTVTTVTTGVC